MPNSWGVTDTIALISAVVALAAMVVAMMQACYAKQAAKEAKRQADAALGEVEPLIFLDSRPFENAQAVGGRAALTLVNHNRRDLRLLEIEIQTDSAIVVSVSTGEMRDIIAAAWQRSRRADDAPLKIDLHDKHHVIKGSSIGMTGSRCCIPLELTRLGDRNYSQETATLTAIVRYVLLDANHVERQVQVSATVLFRF